MSKKFIDDEAEESDGESEMTVERKDINTSDLLNRKEYFQTH